MITALGALVMLLAVVIPSVVAAGNSGDAAGADPAAGAEVATLTGQAAEPAPSGRAMALVAAVVLGAGVVTLATSARRRA
jgi:hypothetical protein